MKPFFFACLAALLFSGTAGAQDKTEEAASGDQGPTVEERAKVKKRLYPGGRDEDSLQVQEQLANPSVGTAPAGTEPEEPAEPADHD
jgi:hypothetical protein